MILSSRRKLSDAEIIALTLKSYLSSSTMRTRKDGDKDKDMTKTMTKTRTKTMMEEKHKFQQQLGTLLSKNLVMLKRTAKSRMGRR